MARPKHRVRNGATRLHSFVLRATRGRLGRRIRGAPVLVLETRGRKSGRVRSVPLLYVEDDGDWVVVGSSGGDALHPAWYLNIEAEPRVAVVTGSGRRNALALPTAGEERARLFAGLVELYPGFDTYRERTSRELPVVRLRPQG